MPPPGLKLKFFGWRRSGIYLTVTDDALTDGRLTGGAVVTLRNQTRPAEAPAEETIHFDIAGPGDIHGLVQGAVTHCMPAPGAVDFEETKCAYVELGAADLPWRYTPKRAAGLVLPPWLVLVAAKADGTEITLNTGGTVTLRGDALTKHNLAHSARWAHVQEDAEHPGAGMVSRIVSPRDLQPTTSYVAVVVPAFNPQGQASWAAGASTVTLPLYHAWTFSTAEEGDFPTLASRLQAAPADVTLGRAPLTYAPLPDADDLFVRGALEPIGATDVPLAPDVAGDVQVLTAPMVDPRRPIVSLPKYGDAWVLDPSATTWGGAFRSDPRHRAVAGLGLRAGIVEQDLLSEAAAAQAGALDAAAQRVRHLTAGLAAARSLWDKRMPKDPIRRLALIGPALGRMVTKSGPVLDRIAGAGRPLPPAIFSSAARRVLRTGPARSSGLVPGAADPAKFLVVANRCPGLPDPAAKGQPHTDDLGRRAGIESFDDALRRSVDSGQATFERLKDLVGKFDRDGYDQQTMQIFESIIGLWMDRAQHGDPLPVVELVAILDPPTDKRPDDDELIRLLRLLGEKPVDPDDKSLVILAEALLTDPPYRYCSPVDLDAVAAAVGRAVDPTVERPFIVDRVLATIIGLDDQPLTPPELCPDLDLPAWQFLRDHDPDWLLPGAQQLPDDRVVAVSTNPTFVDAFLLGVNTQILSELRFRNIRIRSGCTPLRQFWARTNPATESYDDDIVGIHNWPVASALGALSHQTPAAASADLVVVFRTPLFRRYPRTIVYLTPAPMAAGQPDWNATPDLGRRIPPSFQGQISPDITFFGFDLEPPLGARHWVVLEEPSHGFQFFNSPWDGKGVRIPGVKPVEYAAAKDGGNFAKEAFASPYRVMIRGSALIPVNA